MHQKNKHFYLYLREMFTKTDIENYFTGEKTQASIIFFIGIAILLFAIIALFFFKTHMWSGIAIAAGILAIIQLSLGGIVYQRSDKQRTDMVYNYDMNPQKIIDEEIPRMKQVNSNFTFYKICELITLAAGIFLIVAFRGNDSKQFWIGIGIALVIQSIIFLAIDSIASKRAKTYSEKMVTFYQKK